MRWNAVLLCLGALFLFLRPALHADFALDDRQTIHENPLVNGAQPAWQAFRADYWEHREPAGIYRPLVTLSLRAQYFGPAPSPLPFHLLTLALHLGVIFLAVRLWSPPALAAGVGLASLMLFAWHPLQSEVALWIAGRSSSLCALLGLACWWGWQRSARRGRLVFAFAGGLLPLLAKEDGIAFAAAFWFLAAAGPARRWSRWSLRAALSAGVGMALVLRHWALGEHFLGTGHAPLANEFWLERLSAGLGTSMVALRGLLLPTQTPLALAPGDASQYFDDHYLLFVALGAGFALSREWRKDYPGKSDPDGRRRATAWAALAGISTAWLPWLQVVPGPELFGWRALYLPLLFLCPLAWALTPSRPNTQGWADFKWIWGACFIAWCAWGVQRVQPAYASALEHWRYRTELEGHRAMVWNGLGQELLAADHYVDAAEAFDQALQVDETYTAAWVGLANCLPHVPPPADGLTVETCLQQALRSDPRHASALARMGRLLRDQKRFEEALPYYTQALEVAPRRMILWADYATVLHALGRMEAAHGALKKAFAIEPQHPWLITLARRYEFPLPE